MPININDLLANNETLRNLLSSSTPTSAPTGTTAPTGFDPRLTQTLASAKGSRGKGGGWGRGGKPKPQPPPPEPPPEPEAGNVVIDPVTRLEGHLKISVKVETVNGVQQVVDAWATGTLFRGFESILNGRHPADAQHITQRICGVCPVSHGMAAVIALDKAYGVTSPDNARIMRNLVMGANMVDSHILHFYHLTLPDFIDGPDMHPWQPSWSVDKRLETSTNDRFVGNYVEALNMRRLAHVAGAIYGGRLPHPPAYLPGGFTARPTSENKQTFKNYLTQVRDFIEDTYIPDAELLAAKYQTNGPNYKLIGGGYGNLLAFGAFALSSAGTSKLFRSGTAKGGSKAIQDLNVDAITEQISNSWYSGSSNLRPSSGVTDPLYPKNGAYSWLKAPRYLNEPYEAGPLARMWINGDYQGGISVMDRHLARAHEALKVAEAMLQWVNQLDPNGPVYSSRPVPNSATAFGLTEAPRGALGHWLQISNGRLSRYQVITPTCWNASPRDDSGNLGPIEKALIGTPVQDINEPIEVVRVIHSFDPCLSCAVHVMRPDEGKKIFVLPHFHGGEEIHTHDHGDGNGHCHLDHHHAHGHDHDH